MKIIKRNNKYYCIKQNNKYYGLGGTEKIMYATIKGTLMENDGVFSGFSASNYLTLQQQFAPTGNWEIVIKANITTLNVTQTIIGSSTNNVNLQVSLRDTNALRLYLTFNGSSDTQQTSTLTIDNTGIWFFKISFNGSQYKLSVSQDGNSYTDYVTITNSNSIYNNSPVLALGYNGRNTAEYFRNSIDLNNSYIKLGSTKYKLQAVVGYTIVGSSPTIVDGIASNFYTSRYLKISSGISFSINFEMVFKFMITSAVNNNVLFNFGGVSGNEATIRLTAQFTSSLAIWCCFRYNGTSDQLNIDTTNNKVTLNQWYYIKYKYSNSTIEMYLSANGTTWELLGSKSATINSLTIPDCAIGNRTLSTERYFRGSIDLFESYIIIDDKLWFNGHQG